MFQQFFSSCYVKIVSLDFVLLLFTKSADLVQTHRPRPSPVTRPPGCPPPGPASGGGVRLRKVLRNNGKHKQIKWKIETFIEILVVVSSKFRRLKISLIRSSRILLGPSKVPAHRIVFCKQHFWGQDL